MTLRYQLVLLSAVSALLLAGASCSTKTNEAATKPQEHVLVNIQPKKKLIPPNLTLVVGQTVVWRNFDTSAQTIVGDDNPIRSKELKRYDTYTYTFTSPGTFTYHLEGSPDSKGLITIQKKLIGEISSVGHHTPRGGVLDGE